MGSFLRLFSLFGFNTSSPPTIPICIPKSETLKGLPEGEEIKFDEERDALKGTGLKRMIEIRL